MHSKEDLTSVLLDNNTEKLLWESNDPILAVKKVGSGKRFLKELLMPD
ncbi:MAG: hypothetical protein HY606_02675 [Planctomycetes bacterium]|nr:hypothetical protein [Planctomycetota bacterium]